MRCVWASEGLRVALSLADWFGWRGKQCDLCCCRRWESNVLELMRARLPSSSIASRARLGHSRTMRTSDAAPRSNVYTHTHTWLLCSMYCVRTVSWMRSDAIEDGTRDRYGSASWPMFQLFPCVAAATNTRPVANIVLEASCEPPGINALEPFRYRVRMF